MANKGQKIPYSKGKSSGRVNPRGSQPKRNMAPRAYLLDDHVHRGEVFAPSAASNPNRLYADTRVMYLGVPGPANTFQTEFLEPMMDLYFGQSSTDKIDATARQSYFDLVINTAELLWHLRIKHQLTQLVPAITRNDAASYYPFTIDGFNNLFDALNSARLMIPTMAVNIAAFFTPVFQLCSSMAPTRTRPSYWMAGNSNESLANIYSRIHALAAQFDSKVYANQAKMPLIPFNSRMITSFNIMSMHSNMGYLWGQCPYIARVGGVNTTYVHAIDGTRHLSWDMIYGPPPDFYFLQAWMIEQTSNGVFTTTAPTVNGEISVRFIDDTRAAYPVTWAANLWQIVAGNPNPYNYNFTRALTAGTAEAFLEYSPIFRRRRIQNILPSTDAWESMVHSFLNNTEFMFKPFILPYVGDGLVPDYAIDRFTLPIGRDGSTAGQLRRDNTAGYNAAMDLADSISPWWAPKTPRVGSGGGYWYIDPKTGQGGHV